MDRIAPASAVEVNMVRNAARRLRFATVAVEEQAEGIAAIGRLIGEALADGRKILVCGNGGSAACSQHFAAEFTGKLAIDRPALPAIALTVDTSALTSIANDFSYERVFARQVDAYGVPGDVLVALSTSGTSANVKAAVAAARAKGLTTVALTGPFNGLGGDHEIRTSVAETARVQEAHDVILHELAQVAERFVFRDMADDASADRFPFVLLPDQVVEFRQWVDDSGQRLVTTNGVFDLIHDGHRDSLGDARALGDRLVVLVNSDASVRRLKGEGRPIEDEETRLHHLNQLPAVDHVVLMHADDPAGLIEDLRPHVHCKGQDYEGREMPEREIVERHGGSVVLLPMRDNHSTSHLIQRIRER